MIHGFPSLGLVSTFPPTHCGIASFTQSLVTAWSPQRSAPAVGVMRVVGAADDSSDLDEVVGSFEPTDRASLVRAARDLDLFDCVLIEHEFGLFGPKDGVAVLDLLDELNVPVAVTFHTVLSRPTTRQQMIVEALVGRSFATIVLSQVAETRLKGFYDVPAGQVVVIPHGAHSLVSGQRRRVGDAPEVLTWGLISPGKGIEWAIRAVARLQDIGVRYRVLGQTHPKVLAKEGDSYRRGLEGLVRQLGLECAVDFENRYVDFYTLQDRLRQAHAVILPYDSSEQVVSGVLAEAVAAQIPIVASPFPHAVELAAGGAVALADRGDPKAMAGALRRVISDPQLRARMMAAQASLAPQLAWRSVAQATYELIRNASRGVAVA